MKQKVPPCGIVAAAGTQEMMQAILLVLRDLQESLGQSGRFLRVTQAETITQIKQKMAPAGPAALPEILVFGMSQKDAACIDDLLQIAGHNPQVQILLLVSRDVQAQISYRCRKYQIYVLALPLKKQVLSEMLRMNLTLRGRMMEKEVELQRLRKKMNELSVVTKAKCLLIQMRSMTEEEAHHYLERRAMEEGQTKMEIAAGIIRVYS